MITCFIPLKIKSPNKSEHHFARSTRVKKEKKTVYLFLISKILETGIYPPIKIELIRISPRFFDEEDNLRMAFKAVKDSIAEIFYPNMRPGTADELIMPNGKKAFTWIYSQEKGKPKQYDIVIKIDKV